MVYCVIGEYQQPMYFVGGLGEGQPVATATATKVVSTFDEEERALEYIESAKKGKGFREDSLLRGCDFAYIFPGDIVPHNPEPIK